MKIIFYLFPWFLCATAAITPDNYGGRFGDSLLHYLHAKWLSYKYHLPLLYKPFTYSDELLIDQKEIRYDLAHPERFAMRVAANIDPSPPVPTLYICPFFPEAPWERETYPSGKFHIEVDWKDPGFRAAVAEVLAPIYPLELITPPAHTINIAMHVREGGGYDDFKAYIYFPLKFPPLPFYKEGLLRVLELLPEDRPIYCFLFTDARNPEILAKVFSALAPHVTFDYRKANSHNRNVLEDFFSLPNFDILIRPQSNFSVVASLLHDFAILYYLKEPDVPDLIVDETLFHELLQEK